MGAAEVHDHDYEVAGPHDGTERTRILDVAGEPVEVRRNPVVSGVLGVGAAGVSIAYLARASSTGGALDWALALGMGALAVVWLLTLLDARTPLLVADAQGVRIRLGRTWHGLVWGAVRHVEHEPRRGWLRDGRLVVVPHNVERFEAELDASSARHTRLARRLYGAPLAIPLGLTTRIVGTGGAELSDALARVAADAEQVVVLDGPEEATADETGETAAHGADESVAATVAPEQPARGDDIADAQPESDADDSAATPTEVRPAPLAGLRKTLGRWLVRLEEAAETRAEERPDADAADPVAEHAGPDQGAAEPVDPDSTVALSRADLDEALASPTPPPVRDLSAARRHEASIEAEPAPAEAHGRALRRPGHVDLVEDTELWGDRVRPIARPGEAVEPLVLDDFEVEPADDPVIGPEVVAARTRLGLSVDQLADRTRIRPHVIESIEVDDFAPCGGDFYARGHLRTLARVLGIDGEQMLATYDQRYANAPISPRRVFEAELATGANGSIRGTRGGPNWSVLVAAVMALVLCWSVARLLMDSPSQLRPAEPVLNGSGGPNGAATSTPAKPVAVVVSAPAGGAHVVVRDGTGQIVLKESLQAGATQEVQASPPVRVQSSDGSVTVALAGQEAAAVGEAGVAGQGTFVVR